MSTAVYFTNIIKGAAPELRNAACATSDGITLFTLNMEHPHEYAILRQVKKMCESCPALAACDAWIRQAENPPGSWIGVYAGRSAQQRKKDSKDRSAQSTP